MPSPPPADATVARIPSLALRSVTTPWPVATAYPDAIAANWQRRQAANPAFFDGEVFVMRTLAARPGHLAATLSLERFSAFLYWRDGHSNDTTTLDVFCTAIVRSAEGHVLMGLSGPGTLNAGRVYFPGGFLDRRDLRADGTLDLDGSVARELAEETGLDCTGLKRVPGYIVTRLGRYCSLGIEYRSHLSAAALRETVRHGLAHDPEHELADVLVVSGLADLTGRDVVEHARHLLADLLAAPSAH